jgi:hypothetical protein
MSTATKAAARCRQGSNPVVLAVESGVIVIANDLATPHGLLFEYAGHWLLAYGPKTPRRRLAQLLGHYMLHRDLCTEFILPVGGKLDTEADEFADALMASPACSA